MLNRCYYFKNASQSEPVPIQSETTILLAAMTTQPSADRAKLINQLIYGFKQAGLWQLLDRLFIYACHTNEDNEALLNWKNPSILATLSATPPTFTIDRGFTGNGTSSHINTQFNPSVNGVQYTLNSASQFAYYLSNTANFISHGAYTSALSDSRVFSTSASINGALASYTRSSQKGLTAVIRRNSSGIIVFNGFTKNNLTSTVAASLQNKTYYNLAVNAPSPNYSTQQIPFYAVGAGISDAQYYLLKGLIEDYLSNLGAI